MKIGYFEVVEVKVLRSRHVVQLLVEADISQYKGMVEGFYEVSGVFIPCKLDVPFGAHELSVEAEEMQQLMGQAIALPAPTGELKGEQPAVEGKAPAERSLAQRMMIAGYFMNPDLWAAMEAAGIYTQQQHYEAVKGMPPIIIYESVEGSGDVVAHHVRSIAKGAGTGKKPPDWYCLPIYQSHHDYLHAHETKAERQHHLELAIQVCSGAMRQAWKGHLELKTMSGITLGQVAQVEKELELYPTLFTTNEEKSGVPWS